MVAANKSFNDESAYLILDHLYKATEDGWMIYFIALRRG